METYKIALSAGDGIGEELILQSKKILKALEQSFGVSFEIIDILSCGPAIDVYGTALRDEDIEAALGCRAILFGNIGDAQKVSEDPTHSPVYALTSMRKAFRVCTNSRPVRILSETASLSPLKESITAHGMDILIVRDLMGGMITGQRHRSHGVYGDEASDLEYYTEDMIRHSADFAFRAAKRRKQKLASVDKANILYSGKLWRQTVSDVGKQFPEVHLTHHYVDNAAMELLVSPSEFDVVLASNVFGDILADEISQISGTPWLFGSAELAMDGRGVYTPNQLHHPNGMQWAGQGIASPYGIIDATSLLLRYCCGRNDLADAIDHAVKEAISKKLFTGESAPQDSIICTTDELGDYVAKGILSL